jgi:hypothetical protein
MPINQNKTATHYVEEMQNLLLELNTEKKSLEDISEQSHNILHDVDQTLEKLATQWLEHREKYIKQLTAELKDHKIDLNPEEEGILRYNASTSSAIAETLKNLAEKHKVKLPGKASDFTIVAYEAVITALSRYLQKPDSAHTIIKELKTLGEEEKAANHFKEQHQEYLEKTIDLINKMKEKLTEIRGLSPQQQDLVEETKETSAKLEKEAAAEIAAEAQTTPSQDYDGT